MIRIKLFDIEFELRFLFVAVCTLFLLIDKTGVGIISFCACLIHELGHIIAMLLCKRKPTKLIFEVSGIRLIKPSKNSGFYSDLFILFAGSGTNFIVFLLFSPNMDTVNNLSVTAAVHLVLGVINLLPFEGLDGIEILRHVLSYSLNHKTSYIIEKCLQIFFLAGIILLFIFLATEHSFNLSLLILASYIVILTFFKRAF